MVPAFRYIYKYRVLRYTFSAESVYENKQKLTLTFLKTVLKIKPTILQVECDT